MSEITRGVMGMPYEMAMGSELSRRQFYSIAREAYAENQRLLESLQSMIDQTTPLVPIPGDPMWSRRVKIDELMAENESLRKSHEQVCENYNRVSFVSEERGKKINQLKAENQDLRKDAERYRWLTGDHRGDYIWNHVFSDDDRELGNDIDSCIDAAMCSPENN